MSLWDLRRILESHTPWYLPFVIAAFICWLLYWQDKKAKRVLKERRRRGQHRWEGK